MVGGSGGRMQNLFSGQVKFGMQIGGAVLNPGNSNPAVTAYSCTIGFQQFFENFISK